MIENKKSTYLRKDEALNRLAEKFNVAQFVSFSPGIEFFQEYSRVLGFVENYKFESLTQAVSILLERSTANSINIRSFMPSDPRSHEFVYGLRDARNAEDNALRILKAGFHIIINETIDINDGGVSGVLQGGVIEFSPDDTPRCVEKPGTASLPKRWGVDILERVYGFPIEFDLNNNSRLEFSLHPRPCGWKNSHTLVWEIEDTDHDLLVPALDWPNNFSRLIGDKAFGLIIACEAGLPVPMTTVIARRIAPFTFGEDTKSAERWIRTCPREQMPGKYTTHHGWLDPFKLLLAEDPDGTAISSVLSQYAVCAQYSGALIVNASGIPVVEGRKGEGEALMLGTALPEELPKNIVDDVLSLYEIASEKLGPIRFEWVHDGNKVWIVQLHRGATVTLDRVIVPGEAETWHEFEVSRGLPSLRAELESLCSGEGILIVGEMGLTSHVADVLRKSKVPTRLK